MAASSARWMRHFPTSCSIYPVGRISSLMSISPVERIGSFETEMTREFFLAFANNAKMNLHMSTLYGVNGHHIVESLFKGIGHALKEAVTIEGDTVLSTKGVL